MTYLHGLAIKPQVGGFYDLRAGLRCFITDTFDLYGRRYWRGVLMDTIGTRILWEPNGSYSPTRIPHELDIMKETGC